MKLGIYPAAVIPLYLLIDPIQATATLYATPRNGEYLEAETVTFGKPLKLLEPFGIDLDNARFREY